MKITVLGAGAWGTALALVLVDNKNDVTLWTYKTEQAEIMHHERINPRLKGIVLPDELHISDNFDALGESDMIVMGTPSYTIRDMAKKIAPLIRDDAVIVPVSKGIERLNKVLMPVFFVLLVVVAIRVAFLPGAGAGILTGTGSFG